MTGCAAPVCLTMMGGVGHAVMQVGLVVKVQPPSARGCV